MPKFSEFQFRTQPKFKQSEIQGIVRSAIPMKTLVIYCSTLVRQIPKKVADYFGDEVYPGENILNEAGNKVGSTRTLFAESNGGGRTISALQSISAMEYLFHLQNVVVVHHSFCGLTGCDGRRKNVALAGDRRSVRKRGAHGSPRSDWVRLEGGIHPIPDSTPRGLWVFTDMENWAEIRRRVLVDGLSKRAACRAYDIHWDTLPRSSGIPSRPATAAPPRGPGPSSTPSWASSTRSSRTTRRPRGSSGTPRDASSSGSATSTATGAA